MTSGIPCARETLSGRVASVDERRLNYYSVRLIEVEVREMAMRAVGAVAFVTILAAAGSSCGPPSAPDQPILAGPAAPVPAGSIVVDATPDRLTTSRSAHIRVTVLDAEGKPIPNTPVRFVVEPNVNERMDAAGHPVITDVNGRAEDVLRTVARADAEPYVVTVNVRAGEFGQASVRIGVN